MSKNNNNNRSTNLNPQHPNYWRSRGQGKEQSKNSSANVARKNQSKKDS